MANPYAVLGLPADSDDEAIRRRYLELVKQYPPEHAPEKFAAIRSAYESLRDLNFELKAGKLPEQDYRTMKNSLEEEAAAILAEIARLESGA